MHLPFRSSNNCASTTIHGHLLSFPRKFSRIEEERELLYIVAAIVFFLLLT